MKTTFKITITQNYHLQCKTIDEQGKEKLIQLSPKEYKEEYIPCITFNQYFIEVCKESENAIHFIKEWIEQEDKYETKEIQFQNKYYQLLPEVFFSIIINEFKNIVEKEYIIENTIVDLPSKNLQFYERIRTSLETIGLINIVFNTIIYDYSDQGVQISEII